MNDSATKVTRSQLSLVWRAVGIGTTLARIGAVLGGFIRALSGGYKIKLKSII